MTIYRGPGGGGNATTDSEVALLTQLEQSAVAAAASADASEAGAALSAANAATSATNAATSATNAANSATASATSATNSANSATSAATSATNAAAEANLAKDWATKLVTTVDGVEFSSKYYAQQAAATAASINPANFATAAQGTRADTAHGWGNHALAGYANNTAVTNALALKADDNTVVKLTGNQTIAGTKTFSSPVAGDITGNAATVTNGVYLNATQTLTNKTIAAATNIVEARSAPNNTSFSFRNRIINGDMRIDQRNNGASVVIPNSSSVFGVDRLIAFQSTSAGLSLQRSNAAPSGFTNSQQVTVTATTSLVASSRIFVQQRIEGFNTADLGWGAAGAQAVTLSFWVRASVTGTYNVSLHNAAYNRSYPVTYTVNAANTWEYKTITVPGDTTGAWDTGNNSGIAVLFGLGFGSSFAGSTGGWLTGEVYGSATQANFIGTLNATWQITGVQLEAGSVATPFERRPYGTELALCQRYYEINAYQMYASGNYASQNWQVAKRASPTVTITSGSGGTIAAMAGSPTTSYVLTAYASASNSSTITGASEL